MNYNKIVNSDFYFKKGKRYVEYYEFIPPMFIYNVLRWLSKKSYIFNTKFNKFTKSLIDKMCKKITKRGKDIGYDL